MKKITFLLAATLFMMSLQTKGQNMALTTKQQALVAIAANEAKGNIEGLKAALNEGLEQGLTVSEAKEALSHLYAYTGFPRSLNALGALQQVITCWHHTYDARTGLLHHAWDESASQRWSDAEGHSPNFWGRSVGWYLMAMVDILDYIPEGFTSQFNCGRKDTIQISGRDTLISYINQLVDALPQYQRGGLWYQVLDCPDKAGNWPEATVTVQFMYAIAKAVNKGYLPADRIKIAWDAYNGLQQTVFTDCRKVNAEGHVILDFSVYDAKRRCVKKTRKCYSTIHTRSFISFKRKRL